MLVETSFSDMIVALHLGVFFLKELATPQWQKNVRDISREVVAAMREASTDHSASLFAFDLGVFFVNDLSPQWNGVSTFFLDVLSPNWREDFDRILTSD